MPKAKSQVNIAKLADVSDLYQYRQKTDKNFKDA
jgi:hypothetical protein